MTPVWGPSFTRRYADIFLPAQLPNLGNFGNSIYKIITTIEDAAIIRGCQAFHELCSMMEVRVLFGLRSTFNNYRQMSQGYEIGMRDAPLGTPFVYLTPDSVWSLGSFDRLRQLASQGYRAVIIPGLRVNMEGFLKEAMAYPKGMTGRELCAVAERHIHQQFRSFMYGQELHNAHPAAIYWQVDGGLVARHFVLHPLMVHPRKAINMVEYTLDYNVATCVDRSETFVCTDSDDILGVDVALEAHCGEEIRPGPLTDEAIIAWFQGGWPTKFHKWLGSHTLFIHSKDIGPEHFRTAHEADHCVTRIYHRLSLGSFFRSPLKAGRILSRTAYVRLRNFLWRLAHRLPGPLRDAARTARNLARRLLLRQA